MTFHKKLTQNRWQKMSLVEQLANVGSEISRARHWEEGGDSKNKKAALERALELIDLTIEDKRWKKRLKELTRFREVICDWLMGGNIYQISPKMFEDYLLPFVLSARKFY